MLTLEFLQEKINEFAKIDKLSALDDLLVKILTECGIERFAYTYYGSDFSTSRKLKHDIASPALEKWHKHFHKNNYESVDRLGKEVRRTMVPVMSNVHERLANANARERVIYEDALNFGNWLTSLSIPIYGPNDQSSILVIHHKDMNVLLAQQPTLPLFLQLLGIYYQHYMTRLLVQEVDVENPYQLTVRELQCLTLTAQNKNAGEVAEILDIEKRTVNFHIGNANTKLGVKNKYEAVQLLRAKELIRE